MSRTLVYDLKTTTNPAPQDLSNHVLFFPISPEASLSYEIDSKIKSVPWQAIYHTAYSLLFPLLFHHQLCSP